MTNNKIKIVLCFFKKNCNYLVTIRKTTLYFVLLFQQVLSHKMKRE